MDSLQSYDSDDYVRFTGPQRIEKIVHTLEGIVKGISIDDQIDGIEIEALRNWCKKYEDMIHKHPFNELIPLIEEIIEDGIITEEEKEDLLWFLNKFSKDNNYFNLITADMQRLQGILTGIIADGKITEKELENLDKWLSEHEHMTKHWPYDEIVSIITDVLADKKIDEQEHKFLMAFFGEFSKSAANLLLEPKFDEELMRHGVCALCPEIEFRGKTFCFTGKSIKATRTELANNVISLGGIFSNNIRNDVNYLIVGGEGNSCWAFSCYGRKVEQAVALRKQGNQILIIHENDYWDAVVDIKT